MKRGRNLPAEDQGEWLTGQLRDPELCVAYLNAALAEGDQAAFMLALRAAANNDPLTVTEIVLAPCELTNSPAPSPK